MGKHNTIRLVDYSNKFKEFVLSTAGYAGMLMERTSTAGELQPHGTAADTDVQVMFLFEKELEGKGIEEELAIDERVQAWYPLPGDEVLALLANGENVALNAKLASNGDGYLQAASNSGAGEPVAIALEALDLSGSAVGGDVEDRRIKVEVL